MSLVQPALEAERHHRRRGRNLRLSHIEAQLRDAPLHLEQVENASAGLPTTVTLANRVTCLQPRRSRGTWLMHQLVSEGLVVTAAEALPVFGPFPASYAAISITMGTMPERTPTSRAHGGLRARS